MTSQRPIDVKKKCNENRVIDHYFIERILIDFVDMEEFFIHTNFQIPWYTRISLNHSEKMRMNKIRSRRICSFYVRSYQIRTLLKSIPLLFSFENESDFILQYTLEYTTI